MLQPCCYASFDERGNRKYWLLRTLSKMYPYKPPKKAAKGARGATLKNGTLVVDAHWYVSTSGDQMRKSYKLSADEKVTIPVASLRATVAVSTRPLVDLPYTVPQQAHANNTVELL